MVGAIKLVDHLRKDDGPAFHDGFESITHATFCLNRFLGFNDVTYENLEQHGVFSIRSLPERKKLRTQICRSDRRHCKVLQT
jgi:hypothetical protein